MTWRKRGRMIKIPFFIFFKLWDAICSACAYMLNNAGDMDEDDMAQNQKKFRFITETLIERYVLAVLVYE